MATSRVPAAVDALLAILRTVPALADVRIIDGPPAANLTERHRIYVGWQPGGESGVSLTQDFASAGARRRDEDFAISCYAESRTGDKDMSLRRARVFEIVAAVETALRATDTSPHAPTLGGAVLWAHLTTGDLLQEQGPDGALAGLAFSVTCRARI
ncbi:hypothetical protein GCM10010387_22380 [Streptomyces inusitatus]|uniref:Uncharacterized protein n=1 Tax=Streptomyces inusitatus TaxID=68221 RepID=A0A918URJ0_9ACTN|nr:hypothetical protein [Streptomyces inusitatus]GGZ28444.1 hypothetical protein GCM10010387_22380 [Streptomyces inusitatus]